MVFVRVYLGKLIYLCGWSRNCTIFYLYLKNTPNLNSHLIIRLQNVQNSIRKQSYMYK